MKRLLIFASWYFGFFVLNVFAVNQTIAKSCGTR